MKPIVLACLVVLTACNRAEEPREPDAKRARSGVNSILLEEVVCLPNGGAYTSGGDVWYLRGALAEPVICWEPNAKGSMVSGDTLSLLIGGISPLIDGKAYAWSAIDGIWYLNGAVAVRVRENTGAPLPDVSTQALNAPGVAAYYAAAYAAERQKAKRAQPDSEAPEDYTGTEDPYSPRQ